VSSVELPELRGRVRIDTSGVERAQKSIGKAGVAIGSAMGVLAAGAISKAADAVTSFASDSINAFRDVGKEVLGVQRFFGGTAEEASRLRFAAGQSGIGFDKLKVSVKKFSKEAINSDGALKRIGVATTDAAGKTRPLNEILLDTADVFQDLPNGPEKSALAMELFGKSGLDMLPMLSKGKEGLADLMGQADEFGQVIGEKDTQAIKDNIGAQRRWQAALQGAQMQLGRVLLPIMTKFAEAFTIIAVKARPVVEFIATGIARLITAVSPFLALGWNVVTDAVSTVADAFRGMFGEAESGQGPLAAVGDNVTSLADTIRGSLLPVWDTLRSAFATLQPTLLQLGQVFVATILPVLVRVGAFLAGTVIPAWVALQSVLVGAIIPVLARIVQVVVQTVIPIWQTLAGIFINNVLPALQSLFAEFQANVLPVLARLFGIIGKVVTIFVTFAGAILRTVLPPLLRFIGPVLGALIVVIGKAIGFIFKIIGAVLDLGSSFGDAVAAVGRFVKAAIDKAGELWTWIKALPGRIVEQLGDMASTLSSAGGDLIRGFIDGIKRKAGDIVRAVKDYITDKLPSFVKKALGIASPSKVFMRLGEQVAAGMAVGIRAGGAEVARAANALVSIPDVGRSSTVIGAAAASPMAGQGGNTMISVTAIGQAAADPYGVAREIAWQQRTAAAV
jgi:hypothetical protein